MLSLTRGFQVRNLNTAISSAPRTFNRKRKRDAADLTSKDGLLHLEITDFWQQYQNKLGSNISLETIKNSEVDIQKFFVNRTSPISHTTVEIGYQTSNGDGLGFSEDQRLVVVPKTIPGDIVNVRLARHHDYYAEGILTNIVKPSNKRKDKLIVCDKFKECGGCQFQMLTYEDQLQTKQDFIKRAFRFFHPKLEQNESFGMVTESPMQYSYRSKLTPHYADPHKDPSMPIGINSILPGRKIVHVDNCPLATDSVNNELPHLIESERKTPHKTGKTLLLRETLRINHSTGEFHKGCITNPNKVATTRINKRLFQYPAGEFFQNNDYILPEIIDYIKYHITNTNVLNLVDTYCGSGFFGISLADAIDGKIFGVEVSEKSIKYAIHNAKLNGLYDRFECIAGNANSMFSSNEFIKAEITGDNTVVIMDPSRRGSTKSFMKQLYEFKPKLIVYVSCNIFTQARDLAIFDEIQGDNHDYKVKEVIGFDFFPQSKHVESVAIIERI